MLKGVRAKSMRHLQFISILCIWFSPMRAPSHLRLEAIASPTYGDWVGDFEVDGWNYYVSISKYFALFGWLFLPTEWIILHRESVCAAESECWLPGANASTSCPHLIQGTNLEVNPSFMFAGADYRLAGWDASFSSEGGQQCNRKFCCEA